VTITGTNLTGATAVMFNGVAATFKFQGGRLVATVPAGATTGPIAVATPVGTAISSTNFTVPAAPTIAGFSPQSGPAGTVVTISGANFTGATSVAFSGRAAKFSIVNDSQITATVPGTAKTGPISLKTPAGTATSTLSFTVTK
jgi:hypothetical protein